MIASKRHWVTAVRCTGNHNILSSIFKDWSLCCQTIFLNAILCIFHRILQNKAYKIYTGCIQISHFCFTLCWVYFFSGHSVWLVCRCMTWPSSITDLHDYQPARMLRSSTTFLLQQPQCFTSFGARLFTAAAPGNSLSVQTRPADSFETFKLVVDLHLRHLGQFSTILARCFGFIRFIVL